MNIYWHETGPLLDYNGTRLLIGNLNPEQEVKWRLTRWEAFCIGLRFIRAAMAGAR